jgi:hypothetical protein
MIVDLIDFIKYILTILMLGILGCSSPGLHDIPEVEGWVVDSVTQQPLEGVVVYAIRQTKMPSFAGSEQRDDFTAQEAVTNKDGYFKLPAMGRVVGDGYLDESAPVLKFFKPGYLAETKSNRMGIGKHNYNYDDRLRESDWDGATITLTRYDNIDNKYIEAYNTYVNSIWRAQARTSCSVVTLPVTTRTVISETERIKQILVEDKEKSTSVTISPGILPQLYFDKLKRCAGWEYFNMEYKK